jgi:hypothetical protein
MPIQLRAEASELAGINGFRLTGAELGLYWSIGAVGDFNGDGFEISLVA